MTQSVSSIEERVEDHFKEELKSYGVEYCTKTESINDEIEKAFKDYPSKTGGIVGSGNIPDIKFMIKNENGREVPVVIEVKGERGRLIACELGRLLKDQNAIENYAVNGAIHYADAILKGTHYEDVLAVGINGYRDGSDLIIYETFLFVVSKRYGGNPIRLYKMNNLSFLKKENHKDLIRFMDECVDVFTTPSHCA